MNQYATVIGDSHRGQYMPLRLLDLAPGWHRECSGDPVPSAQDRQILQEFAKPVEERSPLGIEVFGAKTIISADDIPQAAVEILDDALNSAQYRDPETGDYWVLVMNENGDLLAINISSRERWTDCNYFKVICEDCRRKFEDMGYEILDIPEEFDDPEWHSGECESCEESSPELRPVYLSKE